MNDLEARKEHMLNTMRSYKARGIMLPFYVASHSLIYESFDNNGGKNPIQIWVKQKLTTKKFHGQMIQALSNTYQFCLIMYKRSLTGKCKVMEKETQWREAFHNDSGLKCSGFDSFMTQESGDFTFFEDIIGEPEAEKAKDTFYMLLRQGNIASDL